MNTTQTTINYDSVIQPLAQARDKIQASINALPLYDDRRRVLYMMQDGLTRCIKRAEGWEAAESKAVRAPVAKSEWDLDDFSDEGTDK